MTRIGMGLVGPGFVGVHHIDAVRRLGFVDVVAIAASSVCFALFFYLLRRTPITSSRTVLTAEVLGFAYRRAASA